MITGVLDYDYSESFVATVYDYSITIILRLSKTNDVQPASLNTPPPLAAERRIYCRHRLLQYQNNRPAHPIFPRGASRPLRAAGGAARLRTYHCYYSGGSTGAVEQYTVQWYYSIMAAVRIISIRTTTTTTTLQVHTSRLQITVLYFEVVCSM